MNNKAFNIDEFMLKDKEEQEESLKSEETSNEDNETVNQEDIAPELDVQKAVVEALATDKAEMEHEIVALKQALEEKEAELTKCKDELKAKAEELTTTATQIEQKENELTAVKAELGRKEAELTAQLEKSFDQQELNPNALALLDRDIELPDRFPGETRDHVLEVIKAARDAAEGDGRLRLAQVLEGVLMANEPNGTLAQKRVELEKLFADNGNILSGVVLDELKARGISHKNGEDYLLPSEILKRNF